MGRIHDILLKIFTRTYLIVTIVIISICVIAGYFEYQGFGIEKAVLNFNSRFSGALITMSLTHLLTTYNFRKILKKAKYSPQAILTMSVVVLIVSIVLFMVTEVYVLHQQSMVKLGESPSHGTAYIIASAFLYFIGILLIFHISSVLDNVASLTKIKMKKVRP